MADKVTVKKYCGLYLEFDYIDKFLTPENANLLLQYLELNIDWK